MNTQLIFYTLPFIAGLVVFMRGLISSLRYYKLKKHGKYAFAACESVTVYSKSTVVTLAWIDKNGNSRKDTLRLKSLAKVYNVGKNLEIYYDDNHVLAVNRKPFIWYLLIGTVCIASGILTISYYLN